jgi:hypothetical protein
MIEAERANEASCPQDSRFVDFFLKTLPGTEESALLDHLTACSSCRAKFDILRDLDPVLRESARDLSPLARASLRELRNRFRIHSRSGRRGRLISLTAAGTVATVIFGIVFLGGLPIPNRLDAERGLQANAMSLPRGRVAAAPRLFVWKPVPGGEYYDFELIDEQLRHLAVLSTRENWVLIPADIQKKILPGRTFIWTIVAYDDENIKLGEYRGYFDSR